MFFISFFFQTTALWEHEEVVIMKNMRTHKTLRNVTAETFIETFSGVFKDNVISQASDGKKSSRLVNARMTRDAVKKLLA